MAYKNNYNQKILRQPFRIAKFKMEKFPYEVQKDEIKVEALLNHVEEARRR
jgi:hypothetical protein